MTRLRFIMVGGFLGAGKTTTLSRLARHYIEQGLRVGLVTNDQAQGLVDTNNLRSQGFVVSEVPGACFCCRFNDLVSKVEELQTHERPEVIMAEPVGSCTDLVATVIQPLQDLYGERFSVAPYSVLFKPSHGLKILRNESGGGFSPKAAYIFRKQLEEADAIVVNRIDEMSSGELQELLQLVEREFPGTPLIPLSAKTGAGIPSLVDFLEQKGEFGRKLLEIDYDIYAEGEAELGWLNSTVKIDGERMIAVDQLLVSLISLLQAKLAQLGGEVAHLKVIGFGSDAFGVANLVSNSTTPELSVPSCSSARSVELIVNARVALSPELLEEEVRRAVADVCREYGAEAMFCSTQSLRPGRPVPTHRYTAPGVAH